MSTQSMEDTAYEVLSESSDPIAFKDLWTEVSHRLGYSEEMARKKISNFYTKLSVDGRFAQKDNSWQLKKRLKFEDVFVDTSAIEFDDSDTEEEEEYKDPESDENELDEENSEEEDDDENLKEDYE